MFDRALGRRRESLRAGYIRADLGGPELRGPGEAAVQVGAVQLHAPEGEIREVGVQGGLRVTGEEAHPDPQLVGPGDGPDDGQARVRERICLAALRQQDRGAGVRLEVAGMRGEARDQEQRRTVEIGRDRDERREGERALCVEGGEGPRADGPQKVLGGRAGVEVRRLRRGLRHSSSPLRTTADYSNRRPAALLVSHGSRFWAGFPTASRGTLKLASRPHRPPGSASFMPTIALVDDDRNILTSVSIALEAEGYRIQTYTDGASALDALRTSPPDLAIFDIKMPRMDGMELLRRLRQKSDIPVIFLTSKDEEIDELFGLKMGADDFIRKPFSQRLLVERVKAVLRRVAPKDQAAPRESDAKALERGQLKMDPERHTCTWNGEPVTLTVTEFLILQALAQRPGVVKSRHALMDAAYDDQVYVDDRTIDSHIKRLRKKFKAVDQSFDMIETLYGVGYRFKEA